MVLGSREPRADAAELETREARMSHTRHSHGFPSVDFEETVVVLVVVLVVSVAADSVLLGVAFFLAGFVIRLTNEKIQRNATPTNVSQREVF